MGAQQQVKIWSLYDCSLLSYHITEISPNITYFIKPQYNVQQYTKGSGSACDTWAFIIVLDTHFGDLAMQTFIAKFNNFFVGEMSTKMEVL